MKLRILFILLLVITPLLTLELTSAAVTNFFPKNPILSKKILLAKINSYDSILGAKTSAAIQNNGFVDKSIIHPYLGFVKNPTIDPNVNTDGFYRKDNSIPKRSPDKIIIGIFGGSFTTQMNRSSLPSLTTTLQTSTKFRNKKIEIIPLAISAWKQPQQSQALNYFLNLGYEFDYIINLDGFNEVGISYGQNYIYNLRPELPVNWSFLSTNNSSPIIQKLISNIDSNTQKINQASELLNNPVTKNSLIGLSITSAIKNYFYSQLIKNNQELLDTLNSQSSINNTKYLDENDFFQKQADIWSQSSIVMSKTARANNINYFHFLQPNQYLPNTKPLSQEELTTAYTTEANNGYFYPVTTGYPFLIEKGKELVKQNINFTDLTKIFINSHETYYSDTCCHLNKAGYDIIAKKIAQTIIQNN